MIHLVYSSQHPSPTWMNPTWVTNIQNQYSGRLKVSTLGAPHTIANLSTALANTYNLTVSANPTFWIFDDTDPKGKPEKITPSLQDLPNIQVMVESRVGSWFT